MATAKPAGDTSKPAQPKLTEAEETPVEEQEPAAFEATEEQKTKVTEEADKGNAPELEQLAGLFTIETGNSGQTILPLRLDNGDKDLVLAALDVLAEVIERKITDASTKRYLGLLLVFIRSALAI